MGLPTPTPQANTQAKWTLCAPPQFRGMHRGDITYAWACNINIQLPGNQIVCGDVTMPPALAGILQPPHFLQDFPRAGIPIFTL